MSKELRECPFCGKSDKVIIYAESAVDSGEVIWSRYGVKCKRCLFEIPSCITKEAAIRRWNTRPSEDAKDKEIDSLVLCLAKVKSFCKQHHDYYAEREKTDIPELQPLDRYMIDWCDYIIETINSTCSGKDTTDDSDR